MFYDLIKDQIMILLRIQILLLNIIFYRNHYDIIFLLFILTFKIFVIRNIEIIYFKVIEINKMYSFINNY